MHPPPLAKPKVEARSILAVALIAALAACLGGAYADGDHDLFKTLAVGVLASVTTIVGFYFGSSKGSLAKDDTISTLAGRAPQ